MPINFFRAILLVLFIVLSFSTYSLAQKIGVEWQPPSSNEEALKELDQFAKIGTDVLIINAELEDTLWQKIDSLELSTYGNLPVNYPTVATFANPDSTLMNKISTRLNQFIGQKSVESIGVFDLGQVQNSAFKSALQPIIQQIDSATLASLYYTSLRAAPAPVDSLFDFKLLRVKYPETLMAKDTSENIGGYIYDSQNKLLSPVKKLLEKAHADSLPVFFNSKWLTKMINEHPDFAQALLHYSTNNELVFPLPKEAQKEMSNHNMIVALMLLILSVFVLNYHYSPIYKKTLSRYFLAHKFLVDDIMNRHVRTITPALVILFQHILATGITAYCLGNVFISEAGWQAIQYHYPQFFISQDPLITILIWSSLLSLLTSTISILWVRLINKKVTHFSQAVLLYSWPLQVNLVITFLIVTLTVSGFSSGLMYILGGIFIIIFLGSFIITVVDTSGYLTSRKVEFLLASIGIYTTVFAVLSIWFFSSSFLLDVLSLGASLP